MLNVNQFRNPEVIAEKDINKLEIHEIETMEETKKMMTKED